MVFVWTSSFVMVAMMGSRVSVESWFTSSRDKFGSSFPSLCRGSTSTQILDGHGWGTRHFGMYNENRVLSMSTSQRSLLSVSFADSRRVISISAWSIMPESPKPLLFTKQP